MRSRPFAIAVLLVLAAAPLPSACRGGGKPDAPSPTPREDAPRASAPPARASRVDELTWNYPDTALGPIRVVVAVPKGASAASRMPVLVALHGRGEARKPPALGARGWLDDYGMLRAFERLAAPPLTGEDFGGMIDGARLDALNGALQKRPYRGVIVVCPYLPDRFKPDAVGADAANYGDFLVGTVLPRVTRETPAIGGPAATGIDGVSLGGRAALFVGLTHAGAFGAVGGIQPALADEQVEAVAALAARARASNPKLALSLVSSRADRFLGVTAALSEALTRGGVAHRLLIAEGDHSYEFNRGPGVYEMLTYYDRALRGEGPP